VTQGVFVRSRAEWMEKGEKNNKYFLNLEKSNKAKSTVRCVLTKEGTERFDEGSILNEIKEFYVSLYSPKAVELNSPKSLMFLDNNNVPKLSSEDQNSCEGELAYDES